MLTTAVAYLLYARGLRTTAVTTATTLGLAEPAVAAVLGLTLLGEHLTAAGLTGLGILGISLAILAWPSRHPTIAADSAASSDRGGRSPGLSQLSFPECEEKRRFEVLDQAGEYSKPGGLGIFAATGERRGSGPSSSQGAEGGR